MINNKILIVLILLITQLHSGVVLAQPQLSASISESEQSDINTRRGLEVKALLPDSLSNSSKLAHPITAPLAAPESNSMALIFRMVQGLGICVGVFLIFVHFMKRRQNRLQGRGLDHIRIIERKALTSKTQIILAQVEGQKVLLSVGSERVSPIDFAPSLSLSPQFTRETSEEEILPCSNIV